MSGAPKEDVRPSICHTPVACSESPAPRLTRTLAGAGGGGAGASEEAAVSRDRGQQRVPPPGRGGAGAAARHHAHQVRAGLATHQPQRCSVPYGVTCYDLGL